MAASSAMKRTVLPGALMMLLVGLTTSATPAPHGAMNMKEQQQLLDGLLAHADPSHPPTVDPYVWSQIISVPGNELTADRIALGRKLYYDTRLSADGTVACATCHDVSRGFTDHRSSSEGIRDQIGKRNAPTTMNAALLQTQFWDGRAPTLEEQAKLPIVNPIEMGQPNGAAAVRSIAKDPQYIRMFQSAYGRAPSYDDIGRALASFERTLIFLDSPFDRWRAGDESAISAQAKRGFVLFNTKARCAGCHMLNSANPLGTDGRFHNVGVSARHQNFESLVKSALTVLRDKQGPEATRAIDQLALTTDMSELGRFIVTKNRSDIGAFKTEQLRNVGITAPYMHDGSMQTLWDVMDHYNRGGEANAFLDGGIEPLALSEEEIDDVVAFLFTLTDQRFAQENEAAFQAQKLRAAQIRPFRDDALAQRKVLPFETRVFGQPTLQ